MDPQESAKNPAVQKLREWDARAVAEVSEFRGETTIVVPKDQLLRAAEFLARDSSLKFTFLEDIAIVDRFPLEPRFEVNYQLLSISNKQSVRLRVKLQGADATVHSVTPVWPTANWHERENYDLFGIQFEGHPSLTRIVMPDEWEGYPLRKDYPTEGYR